MIKLKRGHGFPSKKVKVFGKVFCNGSGEHCGWAILKLPIKFKYKYYDRGWRHKKVLVVFQDWTIRLVNEDAITPIKDEVEYFERNVISRNKGTLDAVQYESHLWLLDTYMDIMKFIGKPIEIKSNVKIVFEQKFSIEYHANTGRYYPKYGELGYLFYYGDDMPVNCETCLGFKTAYYGKTKEDAKKIIDKYKMQFTDNIIKYDV